MKTYRDGLIAPPTDDEIATYRDTFRRELDERMDLKHPSGSPSTESHAVALRQFVANRNAAQTARVKELEEDRECLSKANQALQSRAETAEAALAAAQKDALCWKRLAERHYAARAYPANQHLAEGSLDAYFKAHRDEILAAERKEERNG